MNAGHKTKQPLVFRKSKLNLPQEMFPPETKLLPSKSDDAVILPAVILAKTGNQKGGLP